MSILIASLVGFASGLTASLGLGGGMVMLLYLTAILGISQLEAQAVNLLFFLPIALISLIIHSKSHLIDFKVILPSLAVGAISAALFSFTARFIGSIYLRKAFAVLIIIIGVREVFAKGSSEEKRDRYERL